MKKAGRIARRLSMILAVVMLLTMLPMGMNFALAASVPKITYQVHIQSEGWLPAVTGGKTAGSTGKGLRMEALKINLSKNGKSMIQYNAHVATVGWQGWKKSGQVAGTTGKSKAIEAVKIKLVGDYAKQYDIYYRLHVAYRGWLGWAKNGAISGSTGMALRAEAIQIKLVKKGTTVPTEGKTKLEVPKAQYRAYSQNDRWGKYVGWGQIAGTVGQGKRMEALTIKLKDFDDKNGIKYRAHVSKVGWQGWKKSGEMAGTTGRSLAIEAVQIKLDTGLEKFFDIYYRLHVQKLGWLGWAKNGEYAGTTGGGIRSEAIQICLVNKDGAFDRGGPAYYDASKTTRIILPHYMTGSLKQPYSGPCAAYAYATGLSIITKQSYDPMSFYYNGEAHYTAGHVMGYEQDFDAAEIYRRLQQGLPTMVHYEYPDSQHFVLIAGIREGAIPQALEYGDFLIIDSDPGNTNPQYSAMTLAYKFVEATSVKMRLMY